MRAAFPHRVRVKGSDAIQPRQGLDVRPMFRSPRCLTFRAMQASSYQQVVLRRPADPRRVICTMCEHSEFVHGDYEARLCLYSECGCSGFTLGAGA